MCDEKALKKVFLWKGGLFSCIGDFKTTRFPLAALKQAVEQALLEQKSGVEV